MRIETIMLRGFKGIDRTIEVERLNLLVGPNGSGKSAIMEAVQW